MLAGIGSGSLLVADTSACGRCACTSLLLTSDCLGVPAASSCWLGMLSDCSTPVTMPLDKACSSGWEAVFAIYQVFLFSPARQPHALHELLQ
jgi:hypothetical protein